MQEKKSLDDYTKEFLKRFPTNPEMLLKSISPPNVKKEYVRAIIYKIGDEFHRMSRNSSTLHFTNNRNKITEIYYDLDIVLMLSDALTIYTNIFEIAYVRHFFFDDDAE